MSDLPAHTPGARLLRAVFAAGFIVLALVVRQQPTDGWFAPEAWPWITGATGAIVTWSVAAMDERADTWASASIVVTSVLWIAAVVDVARLAVAAGRPLVVHIIVAVLWTFVASVGSAWPWIMRPSRIRHQCHRVRRVRHDTG